MTLRGENRVREEQSSGPMNRITAQLQLPGSTATAYKRGEKWGSTETTEPAGETRENRENNG